MRTRTADVAPAIRRRASRAAPRAPRRRRATGSVNAASSSSPTASTSCPACVGERRRAGGVADAPDDDGVVDLRVLLERRRALDVCEEECDGAGREGCSQARVYGRYPASGGQGAAGSRPGSWCPRREGSRRERPSSASTRSASPRRPDPRRDRRRRRRRRRRSTRSVPLTVLRRDTRPRSPARTSRRWSGLSRRRSRRRPRRRARAARRGCELDRYRRARRERLERRPEPAVGEHRRVDAACELPKLLERLRELLRARREQLERGLVGRSPAATRARRSETESATSRCCAPSCRLRSSARRASPRRARCAAREARSSSSPPLALGDVDAR